MGKLNFEELMKELSESEDGDEKVNAVLDRIKKLNKENQMLRKRAKESEQNYSKFKALLEENEIDLNEDESVEQIATALKSKTKISEYDQLKKNFDKLQKTFNDLNAQNEEMKKVSARKEIKSKLLGEFLENVYNPEVTLEYRINQGQFKLDESGGLVYVSKDGEEVDNDIFNAYRADFPKEIKSKMASGAGSNPNHNSDGKLVWTKEKLMDMTQSQFDALPKDQQEEIKNIQF